MTARILDGKALGAKLRAGLAARIAGLPFKPGLRVVRVGAFVQSDNGWTDQPKVANGGSELLQQLFGEAGRHARAAVGTNALPLGASVEIELLVEVR